MAQHTPHTYSTGDTITAALLNQAEADLAAAIPKADADAAYDAKGAATTAQAAAVQRANHTGTQSADTVIDGATNKAYTAAEKTKLAGVATAATANATDAALRDRSTHTGTQAASTVTGLSTVATSGAYTDLTAKPTIPTQYTDAQAVAANASTLAGKAPQLVPTATKTAAYTAAVGDLAVMNVAGGATALTLPTAPADKSMVGYLAVGATTAAPLTVSRGGTDTLGPSGATSVTAVLANEATVYQYDAANARWLAVANVKPQTALDGRYAGQVTDAAVAGVVTSPTTAAALGATYAPIRALSPGINVINPKGLRRFSAALGDALFARVPIVVVGDSVTFGQGGDNVNSANNVPDNTQGYVGQTRSLMAAIYGQPGEGFLFTSDTRITTTGASAGSWAFSGPLRHSTRLLSAQTMSFTVPTGVTTLRVIQANNSGDTTATYTKNAGTSTALTTLTGTGTSITTDIAVASGDAIVISGPATTQTYITGLVLITGTVGVPVHRVGIAGYVVGDALGGQISGALSLTSGQQTSAIKKLYDWEPTPGLLCLSFGLNDQSFNTTGGTTAQGGVTAAKYQTWLQQIVTQAIADGWCVLLIGVNRNPSPGTGDTEAQYQAARKAIAQATDHCAAVELSDVFGSAAAAQALGITITSSVHPTRKGHGYYARLLFNLLTTPFGDISPTA